MRAERLFTGCDAEPGRGSDLQVETVIDGIGAGPAAGIAVTLDAGTLLVSGLDPESRRDRVYVLDTKSRKLAQIVEPFDCFSRAAGPHRAHCTLGQGFLNLRGFAARWRTPEHLVVEENGATSAALRAVITRARPRPSRTGPRSA